jgi:hypothetical protein
MTIKLKKKGKTAKEDKKIKLPLRTLRKLCVLCGFSFFIVPLDKW